LSDNRQGRQCWAKNQHWDLAVLCGTWEECGHSCVCTWTHIGECLPRQCETPRTSLTNDQRPSSCNCLLTCQSASPATQCYPVFFVHSECSLLIHQINFWSLLLSSDNSCSQTSGLRLTNTIYLKVAFSGSNKPARVLNLVKWENISFFSEKIHHI
jgi:hypothetical protein